MMNRREKNNFKKIFFNQKFLTLLGMAAIISISFPFVKNSLKQYRINKEISGLKQEIADLQDKNVDLKKFVFYLGSDQFAEEQARLNLGLKKPGEELVVIKPAAGEIAGGNSSGNTIFNINGGGKANPDVKKSNPKKWLDYFFK
ncbi:MAG: septum formation initiator family protein [bacterium]